MKIEAHLNENKDLLVTISDRTTDMEDNCFGVDARWMDEKNKDHFMADWKAVLQNRIEAYAGRALNVDETKALMLSVDNAKVTDGISPKD